MNATRRTSEAETQHFIDSQLNLIFDKLVTMSLTEMGIISSKLMNPSAKQRLINHTTTSCPQG